MKLFIILIPFLFFCLFTNAQTDNSTDTLRKDALNVYMEANDYIKREIPFINYVRDIKEAHVYIISTNERTGSGGQTFSYFLVGQNEFAGMKDTVSFSSSPDDTQELKRQKEVSVLKMALMRYILRTPLAEYVKIDFSIPMKEEVSTDKWDSWVFSTRVNGFLNGQKSYNSSQVFGSFSANRVTKEWKLNFDLNFNNGIDKFKIDNKTIKSENISKSFNALIVKSIGEHWSLGGSGELGSSTYSNQDIEFKMMPGLEYNVFSYSESTRRMLKFLYSAGYFYHNYMDTTIYNKTREHLWGHSLEAVYRVVQKWGSINIGSEWRNYFHDWSLNNLSLNGSVEFRIAKGLSINIDSGASIIHDQLNLVKGGASTEEILLRRKELETQFSYFTSFGITYTFGSIYNNVVNPRFRNGGGGGMIIIF